jgi:hypothetical protein
MRAWVFGTLPDAAGARLADGRLSMGLLMLRCPMTNRHFSTGVNTDRESFRLIRTRLSPLSVTIAGRTTH